MTDTVREASDSSRVRLGFIPVGATAALAEHGIAVLDPFSTLVSPHARIGPGTVLYPNVTVACRDGGTVDIGRDVRLWSGASLDACGGRIAVGHAAEIGDEGGFSIKASRRDVLIAIGERVRLTGGGSLAESCDIGNGAQILGAIAVRACRLAAGGDHTEPDPDRRGAVLKGFGRARGLTLARGMVIQAFGIFSQADARPQSFFHPEPRS